MSAADVTLRLDRVTSLFSVPEPDYFSETATVRPGVDELVGDLRTRRLDDGVALTIELPADSVPPDLDRRVAAALVRYCRARLRELEEQLRALRHEGLRALVIGLAMLTAGLALSQVTNNSDLPRSLRVFFGDGVFLVAAWVGIWYPLDTLIYAPGPLRRDRRVFEALAEANVTVRTA